MLVVNLGLPDFPNLAVTSDTNQYATYCQYLEPSLRMSGRMPLPPPPKYPPPPKNVRDVRDHWCPHLTGDFVRNCVHRYVIAAEPYWYLLPLRQQIRIWFIMIKCLCAAESEISAMLFAEPVIPVFHEMSWLEFVPCRRLLPGCVPLLTPQTFSSIWTSPQHSLLGSMFLRPFSVLKLQYLPAVSFQRFMFFACYCSESPKDLVWIDPKP